MQDSILNVSFPPFSSPPKSSEKEYTSKTYKNEKILITQTEKEKGKMTTEPIQKNPESSNQEKPIKELKIDVDQKNPIKKSIYLPELR